MCAVSPFHCLFFISFFGLFFFFVFLGGGGGGGLESKDASHRARL